MKRTLPEIERQVITDYLEGVSAANVGKKFLLSQGTVLDILDRYGVEKRKSGGKRVFPLREDFFDVVDTPRKAYWLGLLCADGCVNNKYLITLGLAEKDRTLVESFRDDLYPDLSNRPTVKSYKDKATLPITSKVMVQSLAKYGVVPRKSLVMGYPEGIPEHLQHHFIRGCFDGDGTICLGKRRYWSLVGTKDFLYRVQNILMSRTHCKETRIIPCWKKCKIDRLTITKLDDLYQVLQFMYRQSDIHMSRKWEKAKKFMELYEQGIYHPIHKSSSHVGVCFDGTRKKWMATYRNKSYRFDTEQEALEKRKEMAGE